MPEKKMGEQGGQTGFEAWQQIAIILWLKKKKKNKVHTETIWLLPLFPALVSIHIYIKDALLFQAVIEKHHTYESTK